MIQKPPHSVPTQKVSSSSWELTGFFLFFAFCYGVFHSLAKYVLSVWGGSGELAWAELGFQAVALLGALIGRKVINSFLWVSVDFKKKNVGPASVLKILAGEFRDFYRGVFSVFLPVLVVTAGWVGLGGFLGIFSPEGFGVWPLTKVSTIWMMVFLSEVTVFWIWFFLLGKSIRFILRNCDFLGESRSGFFVAFLFEFLLWARLFETQILSEDLNSLTSLIGAMFMTLTHAYIVKSGGRRKTEIRFFSIIVSLFFIFGFPVGKKEFSSLIRVYEGPVLSLVHTVLGDLKECPLVSLSGIGIFCLVCPVFLDAVGVAKSFLRRVGLKASRTEV